MSCYSNQEQEQEMPFINHPSEEEELLLLQETATAAVDSHSATNSFSLLNLHAFPPSSSSSASAHSHLHCNHCGSHKRPSPEPSSSDAHDRQQPKQKKLSFHGFSKIPLPTQVVPNTATQVILSDPPQSPPQNAEIPRPETPLSSAVRASAAAKLPPRAPTLRRSVSDPNPSPLHGTMGGYESPNDKQRLRRMRNCIKEMNKWWDQILPEEEGFRQEVHDREAARSWTVWLYTYVATDKANGDRVAVKKIEKTKMILPIAVEDVKREVKILQALAGHENVVQFYNAFEDASYVFLVMELCEGSELQDRILSKKDSRYSEKDASVVVWQMLKIAAECHLHGLVHRDMKPENFLFKSTKEDSPLNATDFGFSYFIKPGEKFQDIVGSAYYVAPKVLKPESDVWSIGVLTYILLCGKPPFWDKTEDGIFKLHCMYINWRTHDSDKWYQGSRAAFDKFDIDKERDGFITSEELRMAGVGRVAY
ncbi:hypothetical protein Ddye_010057 [Dipteronia dyeriana]|uniref:Protein kinase domain-containing protein n=1 Tax=Dipteronia dyeriana TaxID=168575 RepID=A0AAD9XCU2_9ROSI|nr:hypothetical protein Ddye_010057 [Dipteronia dyeriana]